MTAAWNLVARPAGSYNSNMSSSSQATTVVVADDHPLYRAGLVDAITERPDLRLVAASSGGRDALEQILAERPDVALLDMRMRDLDGMAVLEQLARAGSRTRVVFLSAYEEGEVVHRALTAGAAGYLSKETDRVEICDAVRAAVDGEIVVSPNLPGALVQYLHRRSGSRQPRLGEREHEVMRLTAEGLSAPEIAEALGIGTTTVKTHLQRVYRKLDVTDRAAMVAKALRLGLLT
jgi:two-component system, NarL family, nitrate/nitrite response regulator NarL